MSLRAFHLVFIAFATLLCICMAVWCFTLAPTSSGNGVLILGIISALSALALPYYGFRFYKKAKNLII